MTSTAPPIDQAVIRSIQTVLTQFGDSVRSGLTELRAEIGAEREARARLEEQITLLAHAVAESQPAAGSANADELEGVVQVVQEKLDAVESKGDRGRQEISDRLDRLSGEQHKSIETAVTTAVNELNKSLAERQAVIERAIERLDERLNTFDNQAARLAEYVSATTQELSARIDDRPQSEHAAGAGIGADDLERLKAVNEQSADELRKSLGTQIDVAVNGLNDRLLAAQSIVADSTNQSLADIDAYVGRVSASLDEAIGTLSDRIVQLDRRIDSVQTRLMVPSPAPSPALHPPAAPALPNSAKPAVVFTEGATATSELFSI